MVERQRLRSDRVVNAEQAVVLNSQSTSVSSCC